MIDEIEQLKKENERLAKRNAVLVAEIETVRDELDGARLAYRGACYNRDQIKAERDEARREVCSMNETGLRMNESDKKREAKRRGWDCFEEKP